VGFEVFIQRFVEGSTSPLPLNAIETVLGPLIHARDGDMWRVSDGIGGTVDVYVSESSLMVSRPTRSPMLWASIFEIIRDADAVLFWPGPVGSAVMARESVASQLPQTFVDALGSPHLVRNGAEIAHLIASQE
jgi:hypothetical protein